jgi:signal transduction histidine kinase
LLRAERVIGICWATFATAMVVLMFAFAGEETIPYHLVWASYVLLYGLFRWPPVASRFVFVAITAVTGVPLVLHAESHIIGWEECSEVVLMAFIVGVAMWHVDRNRVAHARLDQLANADRLRARNQDIAARTGSHEVRTRLTIARGFVELIRDRSTDDLIRSNTTVALGELDKASTLVTQLLTLVCLDSPPRSRAVVDLDEVMEQLGRRWAATADRVWSVRSTVSETIADAQRLEAALDALIENSVKFTGPGDRIEVDAHRDGDMIVLSVRDSGCGIPAEDLEHVLEIFATGSTAGERAGSGLGLAIVRAIVDSRRGSLEVESTVDVGTWFTIRFPVLAVGDDDWFIPVPHSPAVGALSTELAAPRRSSIDYATS